ncbi:MAG: phage integrase SAM-like domain-containing protein [Niabella sp.]|nr:phage integrase SAM-like domain-containing protein [Niabella sp.]
MLRINFNIRTTEGSKAVPVYMVARWDNNRLVYPTKNNVTPKHWDSKAQQVRRVLAEPNHAQINNSLSTLELTTKRLFAELDNTNNAITPDELKQVLDYETGRKKRPYSDFWGFIDFFIAEAPKKIDPDTGLKLSTRTIAKYNGTKALLLQYAAKHTGGKLSFEGLDDAFFKQLRAFMIEDKGYNQNTIGKHLTVFKTMLRDAESRGVKMPQAYTGKAASAKPQEAFAIYLNRGDITKLEKAKLTGTLDKVRDNLLIGCYTGLRFSDWKQLNKALVKNGNIELFQEKTGGKAFIPITAALQTILDKNGGKFPGIMSNQKFNQYAKDVAKEAGITDTVQYSEVRGGKRIIVQQPKYDLVSSHTGRRSYATNAYIDGVQTISIMSVTGHRSESAFLKYLKLTKEEHAKIIANHQRVRA